MPPIDVAALGAVPPQRADALIIVPPFANIAWPNLAAHLLQASARAAGFEVRVLYANLLWARLIGPATYVSISVAPSDLVIGERVFSRAAYDLPAFGTGRPDLGRMPSPGDAGVGDAISGMPVPSTYDPDPAAMVEIETLTTEWADAVARLVGGGAYAVVGATTTFHQTSASVALLRRVKALRPATITIIGGANCDGEMAEGIVSLGTTIDHVFSGEGEQVFPAFLEQLRRGEPPGETIVQGRPIQDLDAIPTPDFTEYFEQRDRCELDPAVLARTMPTARTERGTWISYETSRGCWWGEKHHCTFCGLNGEGMQFRSKSPDRVVNELRALYERHGVRSVWMVDNIMPHRYYRDLLPRMAREIPGLSIFYEQKANLTLERVVALGRAGVQWIQPGIESLSSDLLRLIDKGVLARQNVALLRYARAAGVYVFWNLLWGFPLDTASIYEETLALLPLLHHLQPPVGNYPLRLDRFSPYHVRPTSYGIAGLRPAPAYALAFPPQADLTKLAYHFVGTYDSGAYRRLDLIREIGDALVTWQGRWTGTDGDRPMLHVERVGGDYYGLVDTRGLPETEESLALDSTEAAAVLVARPWDGSDLSHWAVARKLGVHLDGWYVPLAVAEPALLASFETEHGMAPRTAIGTDSRSG
jgi:ribosomal peptide maturation radical SAM protein 1